MEELHILIALPHNQHIVGHRLNGLNVCVRNVMAEGLPLTLSQDSKRSVSVAVKSWKMKSGFMIWIKDTSFSEGGNEMMKETTSDCEI
jgi:hypothetical protein